MTSVFFKAGACRITLDLDGLPQLPRPNVAKLFKLMLTEPWSNQQAVDTTEAFLATTVASSMAQAAEACDLGQTENAKKAKSQAKHWEAIQKIWNKCKGD